jgi:hypothetical protein
VDEHGGSIDHVWHFAMLHLSEQISNGDLSKLEVFNYLLWYASKAIIFHTTHDEQSGKPNRDLRMVLKMSLASGIQLEFLENWWHFFCDYEDDLEMAVLGAEKIGVALAFTEADWPYLKDYQKYFKNLDHLKKFATAIHQDYYQFDRDHYEKRFEKMKALIDQNGFSSQWGVSLADLPQIMRCHFKQMKNLAKNHKFNADVLFETRLMQARKARIKNNWLNQKKTVHRNEINEGVDFDRRVNPDNPQEELVVITNWKGGQKGLVTPLNLGWWEIVASNFPVEKTKFRVTMSNRHVVTIPSGGAIELKRIPYPENEQPLSNHLILEFFRNIYSLNVIQPSQAIIFSEEYYVANLSQLGQVEFQEKRIHFGFTEGWLYLLGNNWVNTIVKSQ